MNLIQVFERAGTLRRLIPYLDQMIGIPALNYVRDTDRIGDLPIYGYVYAIYMQILFNHSTLEEMEFDKTLLWAMSKEDDENSMDEVFKRLRIENQELTEDDRLLLKQNKKEIDLYVEMYDKMKAIFS